MTLRPAAAAATRQLAAAPLLRLRGLRWPDRHIQGAGPLWLALPLSPPPGHTHRHSSCTRHHTTARTSTGCHGSVIDH